jgi:hypothetical protein
MSSTTHTWLGATSTAWQNDMNWSGGQPVNGSGDDALDTIDSLDVMTPPPFAPPTLANATIYGYTLTLETADVTFDTVTMGGASGGFTLISSPNPGNKTGESAISSQGTVTFSSNATASITNLLDLNGLTGSSVFENDGSMTVSGQGILENDLTLNNNGMIDLGLLEAFGAITGMGTIGVDGGSALFFNSVAASQTIDFQSQVGFITLDEFNLMLGGTGTFGGMLTNMVAGDEITINDVSDVSVTSYNGATLVLGSSMGPISLQAGGAITGFDVVNSDSGAILTAISCFAAGTHIGTAGGNVPVEDLAVGDHVITLAGEYRPIVWIGHRHVKCRRHPDPAAAQPIRIEAGAFGDGVPDRALYLSPDHAVSVGDALIPIKHLLNGTTVWQTSVAEVTYYHIELATHDLLLAEGLPVESYLETGARMAFANGGAVAQLNPHFAADVREAGGCAPLVVSGPRLEAARALLRRRAATLAAAMAPVRRQRRAPIG